MLSFEIGSPPMGFFPRFENESASSDGSHLLFALPLAGRLEVSQTRFDGTFQRVDFVLLVQERFQFLLYAHGQRELVRNRLSGRYRRLSWRCRRFRWRIDWRRVRLEIGYVILNAKIIIGLYRARKTDCDRKSQTIRSAPRSDVVRALIRVHARYLRQFSNRFYS